MNWDVINIILIVIAVILLLFAVWVLFGGEGMGCFMLTFVALIFIGGAFVRTNDHANGLENESLGTSFKQSGYAHLQQIDVGSETAIDQLGVCTINLEMSKVNGNWTLFVNKPDGTRVAYTPAMSNQLSEGCSI